MPADHSKVKPGRYYYLSYAFGDAEFDSQQTWVIAYRTDPNDSVTASRWESHTCKVIPDEMVVEIGMELPSPHPPRAEGIYRVVFLGEYEAAIWDGERWFVTGLKCSVTDLDITKVCQYLGPIKPEEDEADES